MIEDEPIELQSNMIYKFTESALIAKTEISGVQYKVYQTIKKI